jgi:hypothetical protein
MPLIQSSVYTRAVTRDTANATYTIADFEAGGETINAVDIAQVYWCGSWTVSRNGETILNLVNGDNWFLEGVTLLKEDDTYPIVIENTGTGGTIILVYKKQSIITDETF